MAIMSNVNVTHHDASWSCNNRDYDRNNHDDHKFCLLFFTLKCVFEMSSYFKLAPNCIVRAFVCMHACTRPLLLCVSFYCFALEEKKECASQNVCRIARCFATAHVQLILGQLRTDEGKKTSSCSYISRALQVKSTIQHLQNNHRKLPFYTTCLKLIKDVQSQVCLSICVFCLKKSQNFTLYSHSFKI